MGRIVTAGGLGLVLGLCSAAAAQDSTPSLTGPLPAQADAAPGELPQGLEARPLNGSRAVLAVPGAPSSGRSSGLPLATMPPASMPGDLPSLVGPAESFGSGSAGSARRSGSPRLPDPSIPLVIESEPTGALNSNRDTLPRRPVPPAARSADERRPGLFGRWQGPFSRMRTTTHPDDVIAVEPRSDPAADAALKRRLEQQIQNSLGNKIRSVEVQVVDRDITIHARVNRFWYRRSVHHTLESLPGMTGYKTHVEVVD